MPSPEFCSKTPESSMEASRPWIVLLAQPVLASSSRRDRGRRSCQKQSSSTMAFSIAWTRLPRVSIEVTSQAELLQEDPFPAAIGPDIADPLSRRDGGLQFFIHCIGVLRVDGDQ